MLKLILNQAVAQNTNAVSVKKRSGIIRITFSVIHVTSSSTKIAHTLQQIISITKTGYAVTVG